MGESFMGLPNRFNIIGQHLPEQNHDDELNIVGMLKQNLNGTDSVYNPHHALSAYYGYIIAKYYIPSSGGDMTGNLSTKNLIPRDNLVSYVGTESKKYKGMYAETFYGNATSASKLNKKPTLKLTGAVTGQTTFDGSEATISLEVKVNHNHDETYLKKSGGVISGNITFSTNYISINNKNNEALLSVSATGDAGLGKGSYDKKRGYLTLYSYNRLRIHSEYTSVFSLKQGTSSEHLAIIANAGSKSNLDNGVYFKNVRSDYAIIMKDDGKLLYRLHPESSSGYRDYEIIHSGNTNFIPTTASCNKNWHWSGQPGQPNWLWGGNDASNVYVYNPSNFNVNSATAAIHANFAGVANRITSSTTATGTGAFYEAKMSSNGNLIPYYLVSEYKNGAIYTGVSNGNMGLGSGSNPWTHIFAVTGTVQKSDRTSKYDIYPLSDIHIQFLMLLKPVSYKFKNGNSGRTHIGFIAQDVEDAMSAVGLTDLDFAGFCRDVRTKSILNEETGQYDEVPIKDDNGNVQYIYSLRYDEFISLCVKAIQQLYQKNKEFEDRLSVVENMTMRL